jgi:hypothetical protein
VLLLFIRPIRFPTDEPIIDELTMTLTGALRRSRVSYRRRVFFNSCICGAFSGSADRSLPGGAVTNALCLHYLAYHRAEVPAADLDAIRRIQTTMEMPSRSEIDAPEYRKSLNSMIFRLDGQILEELLDAENETVRWRYETDGAHLRPNQRAAEHGLHEPPGRVVSVGRRDRADQEQDADPRQEIRDAMITHWELAPIRSAAGHSQL